MLKETTCGKASVSLCSSLWLITKCQHSFLMNQITWNTADCRTVTSTELQSIHEFQKEK